MHVSRVRNIIADETEFTDALENSSKMKGYVKKLPET